MKVADIFLMRAREHLSLEFAVLIHPIIFELHARHVGPLSDQHHQPDHTTPSTSSDFAPTPL